MAHAVIDLHAHRHAGIGGAVAQLGRIVAQNLARPRMHHYRWKARQRRPGGRGIGVARIGFAQVRPRAEEQPVPVQRRIVLAVAQHRKSRQRQVGPGRQRHDAARHGQPRIPHRQRHGKGQPAAGFITRQNNGRRRYFGDQGAIGINAVAHRRGEKRTGRQPIGDAEGGNAAGFHQPSRDRAMGLRASGDKAAAMEIQDRAAGIAAWPPQPFPANGTKLARHHLDRVRRRAEAREPGVVTRPHLFDAGWGFRRGLRPDRHAGPKQRLPANPNKKSGAPIWTPRFLLNRSDAAPPPPSRRSRGKGEVD